MPRFNPSDYVDVQERINRFWGEHPGGAIITKLMSPPDDFQQCRYEAQVYHERADQRPAATGYAFELATVGTRGPNDTNHEENCETSAIGRALANMGYAKTRSDRPSRQEMNKVIGPDYEAGEIAAAPQARQVAPQRAQPAAMATRPSPPAQRASGPPGAAPAPSRPAGPSPSQLAAIRRMGMWAELTEADLVRVAAHDYDAATLEALSGGADGSAARFIVRLNEDRDGVRALATSLAAGQPPLVDAPPAAAVREPAHFATR